MFFSTSFRSDFFVTAFFSLTFLSLDVEPHKEMYYAVSASKWTMTQDSSYHSTGLVSVCFWFRGIVELIVGEMK
jgi:hypothetical protein